MATRQIALFNKRDPKAWREILDRYSPRLFFCIMKIISNEGKAYEIVNDCFVEVHKREIQFDTIQKLEAYLFTSARNAAFNFLKEDARNNKNAFSFAQLQDTSTNIDDVTNREIEYGNLLNKIYQVINQQPPLKKEVFELFYFDKKTAIEIAAIKGITERQVYNYKNQVLKVLQKKFGPDTEKLL
ncbi:hypothetical protein A4H97_25420 [Niastella yeongjuensis]|uniref:RNA polymerase sigma-70 region 2 domain-containing protein n=1 Tax=Niastella yeongjuensis TaxID=354355 RepID=A0A1V9F2V9_9BACT|nr:sigma-70 family RNA polymerase sigma factor [Niastella yeongjuensis]OQP52661.1 hypothetical protein A4H97_25420 [Niastella yeongjuensis]SEP32924.1 RNA polymerase sigma-70 factor, ECF subfamily [Niastella yeongjuensis]